MPRVQFFPFFIFMFQHYISPSNPTSLSKHWQEILSRPQEAFWKSAWKREGYVSPKTLLLVLEATLLKILGQVVWGLQQHAHTHTHTHTVVYHQIEFYMSSFKAEVKSLEMSSKFQTVASKNTVLEVSNGVI